MKVISVSGFLGSGKTTTIAALARFLTGERQRVAFLINDVGEVQIDGAVIRAGGHEVVEIYDGCLCLMRDDLYAGLMELADIPDLEWVIIEPSGMADAERLNRLLERFPRIAGPQIAERYRFQCRLTLVDAARFKLLMRSVPQIIRASIRGADVILLNKIDATSDAALDAIENEIRRLKPARAEIARVSARLGLAPALRDQILVGTAHDV